MNYITRLIVTIAAAVLLALATPSAFAEAGWFHAVEPSDAMHPEGSVEIISSSGQPFGVGDVFSATCAVSSSVGGGDKIDVTLSCWHRLTPEDWIVSITMAEQGGGTAILIGMGAGRFDDIWGVCRPSEAQQRVICTWSRVPLP